MTRRNTCEIVARRRSYGDTVHEDVGDATIAETAVTYTRKDGIGVTVPVVTIYRAAGELIDEYRVFLDLTPVFADDPS